MGDIFIDNPWAGISTTDLEGAGISGRGWRCDIVLGLMRGAGCGRGERKKILTQRRRVRREEAEKRRRGWTFDRKSPPFANYAKDGAPSSSVVE